MIRLFAKTEAGFFIIEEIGDGIYLYSFPKIGIEGDTWHQSIGDARAQGHQHFGISESEWSPVPDAVTDLRSFAKECSN